jgi:hypothetical protein
MLPSTRAPARRSPLPQQQQPPTTKQADASITKSTRTTITTAAAAAASLWSTAKEKAPAATTDMATLVATFQTMRHGMEQALQDAVRRAIHG